METLKGVLGVDHPDTLTSMNDLASNLRRVVKTKRLWRSWKSALGGGGVLGLGHPFTTGPESTLNQWRMESFHFNSLDEDGNSADSRETICEKVSRVTFRRLSKMHIDAPNKTYK
jgi:hypothetical protein